MVDEQKVVTCPKCGKKMIIPPQYASMPGKCPACGTTVNVQAATPAPAVVPPVPPAPPAPPQAKAPSAGDSVLGDLLGDGVPSSFSLGGNPLDEAPSASVSVIDDLLGDGKSSGANVIDDLLGGGSSSPNVLDDLLGDGGSSTPNVVDDLLGGGASDDSALGDELSGGGFGASAKPIAPVTGMTDSIPFTIGLALGLGVLGSIAGVAFMTVVRVLTGTSWDNMTFSNIILGGDTGAMVGFILVTSWVVIKRFQTGPIIGMAWCTAISVPFGLMCYVMEWAFITRPDEPLWATAIMLVLGGVAGGLFIGNFTTEDED